MNDFMFTGVSVPRFPRQEMKRPGARRSGSIPDSPTRKNELTVRVRVRLALPGVPRMRDDSRQPDKGRNSRKQKANR